MNFKAPLKIPVINFFVKFIPAEFGISRLQRAAPIGRGLVRGSPIRNHLFNNSVI